MRNRIKAIVALGALLATMHGLPARATEPAVAVLDARSRASGNDVLLAQHVGDALFRTLWSAQVLHVSANTADDHTVIGLVLSGVKFHTPLTRAAFVGEVLALVHRSFDAAPHADEVDLWTEIPIPVFKGEIVSGDLAKPTSRPVFTITAMRGESDTELVRRIATGNGVFWDQEWAKSAFEQGF